MCFESHSKANEIVDGWLNTDDDKKSNKLTVHRVAFVWRMRKRIKQSSLTCFHVYRSL